MSPRRAPMGRRTAALTSAPRCATTTPNAPAHGDAAQQDLERVICERISTRLGRRIRNLAVAVDRGVIRLAGQCSTFYTKQLAQHVASGVLEDEVIDNAIEVRVPCASPTA